jgi:hypothetical protein
MASRSDDHLFKAFLACILLLQPRFPFGLLIDTVHVHQHPVCPLAFDQQGQKRDIPRF